jgi:predicted AlkP superfamily pyrophosphatase or phosphodiesterase
MRRILRISLILLLSLLLGFCNRHPNDDQPILVVLSLDGFRWDYPDKAQTPNLDKIAAGGVKAERLMPSFPTKTFPNHYSLATGLYPDHHGIVNNSFYDPEQERYYAIRNREAVCDGSFYGGEPIWVTAEKQGLKSASLFWVGSEADINGIRPSIWKAYQHDMPYGDRIDTVVSWLGRPQETRPDLIMWYFDQPDSDGHAYGPDSPEMVQTVQYLDSLIGVFVQKIRQLPVAGRINFIVTSDHGMGNISEDKVVMLDELLDPEWIAEIQGGNPNWNIMAADGFDDEIENALDNIEGITCWRSGKMPERLNYGTNPRTLDFSVAADSAWSVFYDKRGNYFGGAHGFDNANRDMHTIFYAVGPAFKAEGTVYPVFRNVNVYPLMCEILGLVPAQNDGNLQEVMPMLR